MHIDRVTCSDGRSVFPIEVLFSYLCTYVCKLGMKLNSYLNFPLSKNFNIRNNSSLLALCFQTLIYHKKCAVLFSTDCKTFIRVFTCVHVARRVSKIILDIYYSNPYYTVHTVRHTILLLPTRSFIPLIPRANFYSFQDLFACMYYIASEWRAFCLSFHQTHHWRVILPCVQRVPPQFLTFQLTWKFYQTVECLSDQ